MSQTHAQLHGYACMPYLHDHDSIELKEDWVRSKNIDSMYFVTATFSEESKPYFSSPVNHYLLVRFRDDKKMLREMERHKQEKTSFVFSMDDDLLVREHPGEANFVSVYYLEYGDSEEDMGEVSTVLTRREQVGKAGIGHMNLCSSTPPRFIFPYSDIVVLEVSGEKGYQSVNKYCEKTRRDIGRKGIVMTNLVSLSILERLK